jgi:hypothetical protein
MRFTFFAGRCGVAMVFTLGDVKFELGPMEREAVICGDNLGVL